MKDTKFFIISGLLVLLFGIGVFVFNVVDTKNIDIETLENLEKGSHCLRMNMNTTTKYKNDEIVAEYEEYFFGCLCNGKFIEDFEFVSSNLIAGPNCDKRCAELCQNRK